MTADRVEFSPEAAAELDDLVAYIAERNPSAAERVRATFMQAVATLAATAPRTEGREVTLDTGEKCRRWYVAPVLLFYQRAPEALYVVHVWHHARAPIAR
ncbi:MAG: type II toxin-antitoxin system RelE/ParE family toxin [Polyangiales bacterium]